MHSSLYKTVGSITYSVTYIYIGWPGSVHDARVFVHSSLYKTVGSITYSVTYIYIGWPGSVHDARTYISVGLEVFTMLVFLCTLPYIRL